MLLDITSNYDMFSFMNRLSSYKQMKIAPKIGNIPCRMAVSKYYYTDMPFNFKNIDAKYQRAI